MRTIVFSFACSLALFTCSCGDARRSEQLPVTSATNRQAVSVLDEELAIATNLHRARLEDFRFGTLSPDPFYRSYVAKMLDESPQIPQALKKAGAEGDKSASILGPSGSALIGEPVGTNEIAPADIAAIVKLVGTVKDFIPHSDFNGGMLSPGLIKVRGALVVQVPGAIGRQECDIYFVKVPGEKWMHLKTANVSRYF